MKYLDKILYNNKIFKTYNLKIILKLFINIYKNIYIYLSQSPYFLEKWEIFL